MGPVARSNRLVNFVGVTLLGFLIAASPLAAQAPPGYYATVDATDAPILRQTLHEVIDDHTRFPYTAATTDTWDILNLADEDPQNPNNIIDVYRNASYQKISGGIGAYNREHVWPKSFGFPNNDDFNYPYTDCHHLFLSDAGYNSQRSNKPFRNCGASCAEWTTDFNDGRGGGSGLYPGNSNWTMGSFSSGTWEAWGGRKGDVARAIFYMAVRYEGGVHGVTGAAEPDLRLTDDDVLIDSFRTGQNESVAYMGVLTTLLEWHLQDPVDSREQWRNEVVFTFQGNRNPFIDHPEWIDCLYNNLCGGGGPPDTTAPGAPMGLVATAGAGFVDLDWLANGEGDLAGYNIYRSTTAGGPYTKINGALMVSNAVTDSSVAAGTTYFYVVTAVDTSANESTASNESSATPSAAPQANVILSEVFYDASGADDGLEWVELFNGGASAVDLSTFSLGSGGTSYTVSKVQLSGVLAPGATFVVGGPTATGLNANPVFDLVVNFSPDLQNSGATADGVALFDVPAAQVNAATVPVDAVVYGGSNANLLIDETGVGNAPEVGDASPGSSIERFDLAGSWRIQAAPTPNTTPLGGSPPGNSAPAVTIGSPAPGATFNQGDAITFSATASDAEDGDLSAGLGWTSSLDGAIGSGGSFSTSALSVGIHVVTASVTDSGGLEGLDSITVTVNGAPSGDTVTITKAQWDSGEGKLKLKGTVSSSTATLTVTFGGRTESVDNDGGQFEEEFKNVSTNPVTVTVTSSGGGSDTVPVKVK